MSKPVDLDAWRAEAGACAPIDAAATPAWIQAHHIDEPRAIVSADDMNLSLLALNRDGMAIFDRVEDARFAVKARDGWPRDAARVVVLCERVAAWRAHQLASLDYVPHPASIEDRCALEKRREATWAKVMRVDPGWEREAEEAAQRRGGEER